MNTRTAQRLMHASMLSPESGNVLDREIESFSIDSRTTKPGALFFALSPEDYRRHCFTATVFDDAHRFIPQAFERGAVAAVARRRSVEADAALMAYKDRLLLVDDVIDALQSLARGVLEAWQRPVVAITGSAGKTTTKDLTAHVLEVSGRSVLKSQKNFNNELGVPLSVLQLASDGRRPEQFDVAVIEMGMSMPGEIARLSQVAPPDIAVELCVLPVHLEFMGTIERIAATKAELIENLKPEGTAVLNADDKFVRAMREKHKGRTLTYGIENIADVMATNIEHGQLGKSRFRLRTPFGEASAELPMPGLHNLMNALAAAAVACCFEIEAETIARSLTSATPSEMRGEVLRFAAGFTVVDDSYNSNPRALAQMVQTVAVDKEARKEPTARRIVVAGEMLELGPDSREIHRAAGREIAGIGADILWGVRGHAQDIVRGAQEAGMGSETARFFESAEQAAAALVREVREGDLVLVKGSRGVHMEKIVSRLRELFPLAQGEV